MKQIRLWMLAALLTLCGVATAQAQDVSYVERSWDETNKQVVSTTRTCSSYTAINGNDTSDGGWVGLYSGWYVVTGNSEYKAINVQGDDVHLIIPDGMTLNVTHIKLESGHKLSIYGQGDGTGKLVANNADGISDAAGIGGGDEACGGVLVVQGGIVEATGNKYGAGIGGGDKRGFAQTPSQGGLFVYGGSVKAQGGQYAAGIGSGDEATEFAGYVTIYGGEVKANGGMEGAGIGGGNEGMGAIVNIYGGKVEANGGYLGAGIGGGDDGSGQQCTISGGNISATGGLNAAGIGGGENGSSGHITINGGSVQAEGEAARNYNSDSAKKGGGAGIGSGSKGSCDQIVISGGTIYARGGGYYDVSRSGGAGIGGGYKGGGGTITISGGTIEAYGYCGGASIGAGDQCLSSVPASTINISGGMVYANMSIANEYNGAGVGYGFDYSGGTITINITGGKVYATPKGDQVTAFGKAGKYSIDVSIENLSIPDNYMVKSSDAWADNPSGATLHPAADRKQAMISRQFVYVEPCDHTGATYTVSGTSASDTHTKHCNYCTTAFETGTHTFNTDGKCTVCGVSSDVCTVTIYLPKADTQTDGDYHMPISYQMVKDETFQLPPAPNTPTKMEFAGWVVGDVSRSSFITDGSETLLEAESEYTIMSDVTLTARYKWLVVVIADDADNGETLSKYNGKATHAVSCPGRTLYKDGKWNTLCLPFDVTIAGSVLDGDNVEAKVFDNTSSLSDAGVLTLNFSAAPATITAGTPFIVKWDNTGVNLENPVFTGVTISSTAAREVVSTDEKVKFVGQYSPFSITSDNINEILYVASGNKIGYSAGPRTLKSCRAHFWVKPNGEAAAARAINIDWGDGEATGITTTNYTNFTNSDDAWYTLYGRKLSDVPTTKGVYIVNGRKIVVK